MFSDSRLIFEGKKLICPLGLSYHFLPSQVIALYSGEELRLWEDYYQKSYIKFFNSIKKQNKQTPELLYINKYVWVIGFITLVCNEKSQKFIKDTFEINLDDGVNIKFTIDNKKYQKFLDNNALKLVKRIEKEIKNNGIINSKTLATFDIGTQQIKPKEIFEYLYITSSPTTKGKLGVNIEKIITNIEVKLPQKQSIKHLSEGQKKQIFLKLCLEVLADENSLILFDEPDAHIHIANKKLIPDMLKEYEGKREVILTTHSPTLAHSFDMKHLAYVEDGQINQNYNKKSSILDNLSNGLMGISEQQILLQSNKDILIVEGKTDEIYISTALNILKKDNPEYKDLDFNFLWLGGTDADNLNKIITEFTPKESQTIIAFFDRDNEGCKCIKKALYKDKPDSFNKDSFVGETKNGIHIHFYPKKDGFTQSNFEVEDYFPIKTLQDFMYKESQIFEHIKAKFKKLNFAEKCQKEGFDKTNFDGFKKLFNLILKIKTSNAKNRKNGRINKSRLESVQKN